MTEGAFGTVYLGWDKPNSRMVAIKVFDVESPEDDINDLQNEIGILASLRHPNVTEHYVSFFKGHYLWIVMELVDYGSCAELVIRSQSKERSYSDESTCKIILRETLKALAYIHENNLIHRDLKAANILLNSDGGVKLADFGVSARIEEHMPSKNTFVGTPLWMAPEVINTKLSDEKGYTSKIDIWSLGIVAYEIATGKPPHALLSIGNALAIIGKGYEPKLPPDFSIPFQKFVGRCLKADPTLRPHAHELLDDPFFDDCPDKSELIDLIRRFPRPNYGNRDSNRDSITSMKSLATTDAGWDWNWGSVRSSQHFHVGRNAEKEWGAIATKIEPDGTAVGVDIVSGKRYVSGQHVRPHRRATSTTEVPAAGRKSMDARTPVSRPSTANNQPASRPSTGVKDYGRDREATVKAGSFGRQLASAEVNARVAGHRAGRGLDVKDKLVSDRSRNNDIGEAPGSQTPDRRVEGPRIVVRRGSRVQETKERIVRRESLGPELPTARPQPSSSRPTSSRANTSYEVRDQQKFPILEKPQREDYFSPEITTVKPHPPSSSRPSSSSAERLARSSNGSMPRHTLERQSSRLSSQDNDPFQSGFKTAAPHDSKGQLGRNAFDFVVKATIEELYYGLQPGKKRDVIKNLGKAWAELDAISPELELTVIRRLCRGIMEYPELRSVVLNDAREADVRSPQEFEDFSEDVPVSEQFRRSGSKSSQESLARSRRLAVLNKHDAEPLFATTKNEQMKNQHWHRAYRSSSAMHIPQEPTIEESNPSTPTPQVVPYEVQAIEAKLRILQENMRMPSQSAPTDFDDLSPLDPSQKMMFDNLDRLRQESKPQLVALRHAEMKEVDENNIRSTVPNTAERKYLRASRETTPVADEEIRSILRSEKEKASRRAEPKRPSFSYDGAGSDTDSDGPEVVPRTVSIDMTPSTPKIQRKRKSVVRINPNEEIVEIKAAPIKSSAPSPVKLFSPRTRLRQALLSDDEASPVQPSKVDTPETPTALPEGARTPLMQKKITQLRSPEEIIQANAAKQPRSPVQSENVGVERPKNRLAFARKVEYANPLPDAAANVRPLGRRATRASLPSSKASVPGSRPRAKSTATDQEPQVPARTPGRKRSQSNLAENKPLVARSSRLDSSSPTEQQEEIRSKPSTPAPPRSSRLTPSEQFGPELQPARRLDRPIMRPISQPAARPPPARLGRPFTAHASAPVLGANGATREQHRAARPNTERSEYQWQRRGDMKKLDDYLNGRTGGNHGLSELAHRQQATKAVFENL
ncbi:putative protein serine/threonine kinase, variant 2 [Arthrobotrys megalospora]